MTKKLPRTTCQELLLLLLSRRKRLKVVGQSMEPLLQPGDEILLDLNAYRKCLPQVGDIIVTMHPFQDNLPLIKRISSININDNSYFIMGDNSEFSTDSRHWGSIKLCDIRGKVTSQFY